MFKEIAPTDVAKGDNLIIVNLRTGKVHSGATVTANAGSGNFNYSHPEVDNGRLHAGYVISDFHGYVRIYREVKDQPEYWPPQDGDVWCFKNNGSEYHVFGDRIRSSQTGMEMSLRNMTGYANSYVLVHRKGRKLGS